MAKQLFPSSAISYIEELAAYGCHLMEDDGLNEENLRTELKKLSDRFISERKYKQVKLINHILMEMDISEKKEEVSYLPPKILVEHTNLCNAQCIMCSHYYSNNYGRGFIKEGPIEKLREILPYVDKILLHGIGEPFLHPNIMDYIRMYRSYGAEVSCNTNMSVMNEELAGCIRDCFEIITVSCDSPVKETFENIRKKVSYDAFCRNVELLRTTAPDLEIRMNVVAMRQNLEELPEIIPFAEKLGINSISIMDLTAQKYMENEEDEIWRYPAAAGYYIRKTLERAENSNVKLLCYPEHVLKKKVTTTLEEDLKRMHALPIYPDESKRERLSLKYRKLNVVKPVVTAAEDNVGCISSNTCEGICNNFADTPFLSADADIFCCCIDGVHTFGNLNELSFGEIWNGPVYQLMRRNFYSGHLPKYCKACSFLKGNIMSRLKLLKLDESFYENEFSILLDKIGKEAEEM